MSGTKRRKTSGLSGTELIAAYNSLLAFKNSLVDGPEEEISEAACLNEPLGETFDVQLDAVLSQLQSRINGPQGLTFSNVNDDNLAKLNITCVGFLVPKPGFENRLPKTASIGKDKIWSSENLCRHLEMLENLVPSINETSARVWIDAFFFRVRAMLPEDKRMVVNMEHHVMPTSISPSSLTTLSGYVDYTAIVADALGSDPLLSSPYLIRLKTYLQNNNGPTGFFVVEAKFINIAMHVPQAVSEMYACGKFLGKKIIRGALTNGREWMFLILTINDNYDGASYKESSVIKFTSMPKPDGGQEIPALWPNFIAAILSHWINNGFADLGTDDWLQ